MVAIAVRSPEVHHKIDVGKLSHCEDTMKRENIEELERLGRDAEGLYPYLVSDEKSSTLRPTTVTVPPPKALEPTKTTPPWVHFVAGGVGGMVGAVVTCPLDVVKTRLQLDQYHKMYNQLPKLKNPFVQSAQHLGETFSVIRGLYRQEGPRALFKGLGPNLVGVIPARLINFFTYGTTKDWLRKHALDPEATWVHLVSGINAGFVTLTATNPIWLIKTRLQLNKSQGQQMNLWTCLKQVVKNEGFFALYKGLLALYLGGVELTLQWVLYEQMRLFINRRSVERHGLHGTNKTNTDFVMEWAARLGAAGAAKFIASLITYPHEVVRTRLRQAPLQDGRPKYTGLIQCFRLVIKEEGLALMYGGLTPHLLRTVPNSIIMFGTWELIVRLLS